MDKTGAAMAIWMQNPPSYGQATWSRAGGWTDAAGQGSPLVPGHRRRPAHRRIRDRLSRARCGVLPGEHLDRLVQRLRLRHPGDGGGGGAAGDDVARLLGDR
jgi:hypothetical protein